MDRMDVARFGAPGPVPEGAEPLLRLACIRAPTAWRATRHACKFILPILSILLNF